jgi:GNAT superfamily N-acetyltransferase
MLRSSGYACGDDFQESAPDVSMNGQARSPEAGGATDRPVVRAARRDDAALIAGFNLAMARETERRELDPQLVAQGVAAVLADDTHGFYLLAEVGACAAGALLVTYEWSDWRNARMWWIQSVYVVPAARRMGVYRALYGHVRAQARAHGACGLRLYVEQHNRAARQVYRSMGMRDSGYRIYEQEFAAPCTRRAD